MSNVTTTNRNRWRRVYGYERQPAIAVNVTDEGGVVRTFDANGLAAHNDFYLIGRRTSGPTNYGQYDEDFVWFVNATSATKTFNTTFSQRPVVALVVEDPSNNVNPFIVSATTSSVTIGVSAFFSGAVRYRAVYSAIYPVTIQRSVLSSSDSYTLCAGTVDLAGASEFTASFGTLGTVSDMFFGAYDVSGSGTADVAVVVSASLPTSVTASVSAPLTNAMNYIVVA